MYCRRSVSDEQCPREADFVDNFISRPYGFGIVAGFFLFFKEGREQMTDNSLITPQSLCFGRQSSSSCFKEKQECAKCNLLRAQEL